MVVLVIVIVIKTTIIIKIDRTEPKLSCSLVDMIFYLFIFYIYIVVEIVAIFEATIYTI